MIHFVGLVIGLSVPFWILGSATGPLVAGLPASALMFVCPLAAAVIVTARTENAGAALGLLKSPLAFSKIGTIWYWPILLLKPAIMLLSYWVMRWIGLPDPRITAPATVTVAAIVTIVMGSLNLGETLACLVDPQIAQITQTRGRRLRLRRWPSLLARSRGSKRNDVRSTPKESVRSVESVDSKDKWSGEVWMIDA